MIGQTLGQYRLLEKIGAGGMGIVYRAHDERLDRDVALKVLPAGTLADEAVRSRFRKEARALSKLNHPNIATVHDFNSQEGVDFLVMELIPGTTLSEKLIRGPLPEREVLHLGAQLAQGLAAAHEQGVVHRDLKPGNLRLTPDGRLKVLDFGLAMLHRPVGADPEKTPSLDGTSHHGLVGSPPYMAPEQLRGERVDPRSDVYAAGALLYEMATGQRPFPETQAARLFDAILHKEPVPPTALNSRISSGLEAAILKALDKDPERRYQSAKELLVDLMRLTSPASPVPSTHLHIPRRGLAFGGAALLGLLAVLVGWRAAGRGAAARGAQGPAPIRSLAVLPLANLSGDAQEDYFSDGMTDALTADLGKIASLRVISRTSAMQYRGARKSLPEIARDLGVDAVVEGSVLRSGDRVRITTQLIHAPTDRRLWSESYERDLRDVVSLQSEVARSVAREIQVSLTAQEQGRLARTQPVDPGAHEAYLRGRHHFSTYTEEAVRRAIAYFEQAIQKDPGYAPPYAGLADSYVFLAYDIGTIPPDEAHSLARAAAVKARELDEALPEAHLSLAWAGFVLSRDWGEAEAGFKRALALNPSHATAHSRYASYLTARGRLAEALAEMRRARDLDPLSPVINAGLANMFYYARQPSQAVGQLRKTLELKPDFVVGHYGLGLTYLQMGKVEEAIAEMRRALDISGRQSPAVLADLGRAYAVAGRPGEARQAMARWKELTKGRFARREQLAHVHASLGEKDQAFRLLQKAYEERSPGLIWLSIDPRFDSLRSDSRFQELLRRLGLPESPHILPSSLTSRDLGS